MAFIITKANSKGVLLTRNDKSLSGPLFIGVGVVITFIGFIQLYFYSSLEGALKILSPFISLLGLVGIFTGMRHPSIQRKSIPDSLYFDNENGRLEIKHRLSENQNAFIYFDELMEFVLDVVNEGKITRYIVLMKKVDGGQWDLYHSTSYRAASKFLEILKSLVKLSTTPNRDPQANLALSKVYVDHQDGALQIYWKKNVRESIISLLMLTGIFFLALVLIVYLNNHSGNSIYFIAEIIAGLMMLVVVPISLYFIFRDYQTTHFIEVDQRSIHVMQKTNRGKISNEKQFSFPKLFSIYYRFNSYNPDAKLYFVDEVTKNGSDSSSNEFAVSLPDLTSVEVLGIESYIQEYVRNNSTVKVL